MTEVQWQGMTIPVKNERIRVCLIKMNQLGSEIGMTEDREEKMALFENLLMECQDSIQHIKDDLNQDLVSQFST